MESFTAEGISPEMLDKIMTLGINIIGAILILIAGRIAAGIGRKVSRNAMTRSGTDPSLMTFVGNIVYYIIFIFAVVAALAKFGIETASFVAILGAASFAIGFALQGSLANFASGVMVLVFRPFKVGDFIDAAGVKGTVKEIGLFATTIATGDNIKILVPNGKVYGDTIQNYSAFETRRVDLVMGIGYDSSIDTAEEVMLGIIKEDKRIHSEPAPFIAVSELADSSVNFVVRTWVDSGDYWAVKFDLTEKFKKAFDSAGIDIPYPQQVVHHMNAPADS